VLLDDPPVREVETADESSVSRRVTPVECRNSVLSDALDVSVNYPPPVSGHYLGVLITPPLFSSRRICPGRLFDGRVCYVITSDKPQRDVSPTAHWASTPRVSAVALAGCDTW
jgi:hypothetical protein